VLVADGGGRLARAADAPAASTAGEILVEPSTLHCVAVRWPITGDANENATIQVHYRKAGDAQWKPAYPLFRTRPDPHPENKTPAVRVPGGWMFAGSVVALAPQTDYEVKLALKDPDGGDAERTVAMRTIGEPVEPPGMRVRHVTPGDGGGAGTEADPFRGLPAAVAAAEPGDILLLRAGTYTLKETLALKRSGEPGKPIILRGAGSAGDAATILDGGGTYQTKGVLLGAQGVRHVWVEDLTLRGKQYAIAANGASNWVIRRCAFRDVEKGFTAHNGGYAQSRGHFIADNVFTGPTAWPRTKGIEAYTATYMSGAGHVVCYNRLENLGDGIHGTGYGNLSASDFHNNDVHIATDDGIETDYGETNVRVFHNRIVNVAHGVSAQPAMGGPIYVFRNVIYNATYSPFKLHNHTTGVLIFHNTSLRAGPCWPIQPATETVNNVRTRNNLFLGTKGTALTTTGRMRGCDFDADGYGGFTGPLAAWNGKTYKSPADAKAAGQLYAARGAFLIDPARCFASGLLPPTDPDVEYRGPTLDFRLKDGSDALDKGEPLPNFNDGFAGAAPDLGAIELGAAPPQYGPRPRAK